MFARFRRRVPAAVAVAIYLACSACARAEDAAAEEAITPKDGVIQLFNGQDLSGLTTWLADTKHEDPRQVFQVTDGMLHISGDGFGYIRTNKKYRDYHLIAEFRWGERVWQSRKEATKDSGILLHGTGEDGNVGPWMTSIEFQVIEGGVGDFIVIGGKDAAGNPIPMSVTCEVALDRDGETVWKQGGERKVFPGGRVNWYGRDPDWEDKLGFRGKEDVESPGSEWTRCEAIVEGGHIKNIVNGVVVNEALDSTPQEGYILLQTECAEIFFRKFEVWPLGMAPDGAETK